MVIMKPHPDKMLLFEDFSESTKDYYFLITPYTWNGTILKDFEFVQPIVHCRSESKLNNKLKYSAKFLFLVREVKIRHKNYFQLNRT